jgi:hypothetical protein
VWASEEHNGNAAQLKRQKRGGFLIPGVTQKAGATSPANDQSHTKVCGSGVGLDAFVLGFLDSCRGVMSHAWIAHLGTMSGNILTPVEAALTGSVPGEVSSRTHARDTAFVTW